MRKVSGRDEDQLLDDGLEPLALGRVAVAEDRLDGNDEVRLLAANPEHGLGGINCAGFRRRDSQDRTDYLFHAEGWKDACDGLSPKDVARACAEAGLLEEVLESGKVRFQKNVKVPGRGTERFYFITGRGLELFRVRQAEG